MTYKIVYTKQAIKDQKLIKNSPLAPKAKGLLELLRENPFQAPPPYEALMGNLKGAYSRRINYQHRLVYEVHETEKTVKIIRMWTHYNKV